MLCSHSCVQNACYVSILCVSCSKNENCEVLFYVICFLITFLQCCRHFPQCCTRFFAWRSSPDCVFVFKLLNIPAPCLFHMASEDTRLKLCTIATKRRLFGVAYSAELTVGSWDPVLAPTLLIAVPDILVTYASLCWMTGINHDWETGLIL